MKADTVTKDFVSDSTVFADIFNYYIYGGQQIIQPEKLTERDSAKIALSYGTDGTRVPVQKFRDVQKLYTSMTDGKIEYVLYSAENQSEIHYAMAVKNNLYDVLDYAGQVEEVAKSHRKAMKQKNQKEQADHSSKEERKKSNSGEFLGGFWKEDKLIPSVTLTIYFGSEQWDTPLSLFEMMKVSDPKILSCMDNYHVRLIAPALMSDEEIMKFQSNLREVMLFIKYSKDKEKLKKVLKSNERRFREVERRAVDVIEIITNTGLHYDEKETKIDMCQAIQEMRMESERIGECRGEKIGQIRGEDKKAKEAAQYFYNMGIEVEKVAEGVGYSVETVKQWLNLPV